MDSYPLLNRCAVIVTPKPPFWEWVNKTSNVFDDDFRFERDADSNIYLVPGYESEPDISLAIANYIGQNHQGIFISELEAWNADPTTFPEISYDRFHEWFSLSSHTMIFDTVNKPLKKK
jgi:hypothetical protein